MVNPVFEALQASNPYEQLISQIIFVESQPMFELETKKQNEEIYKGVLSNFDSTVSTFHSLLKSLTDSISNPFEARTSSFPKESGFSVSASDDTPLGTHNIQVERLASTDTRVSQQYSNGGTGLRSFFDTKGAQTFTVNVADPTEEDPDNRVDIDVTVDPTGDTDEDILNEISQAINAAMAEASSSELIDEDAETFSSVINETSDTARLSLRSGDTGYANRLEFTDSGDGLLSMLGINNNAVSSGTDGGMITDVGTSESDSSLNAKFMLDGLTLYRSSNQVSDALNGLTIDLKQTMEAPDDFTVTPDTESIKGKINEFIEKYNSIIDFIDVQSEVDGDLEIRGLFAGESTFTGMRFNMRNLMVQAVPGQPSSGPTYITDLGIKIEDDGTLTLDDADALIAAVEEDPSAVQSLFAGDDGLATRMEGLLDGFLGANGIIDNRIDAVDARITRYDNRIERSQERLDQREASLRLQYAHLQEVLAGFQSQQSFLSGFFG